MKAYLAGDCFFAHDIMRCENWYKKLTDVFPSMDLYVPIFNKSINGPEGKKKHAGSKAIVDADMERLDNSDILIVCLDGNQIPPGSASEIGVMYDMIRHGAHKYVVGIWTDTRQLHITYSDEKLKAGIAEIGENEFCYANLFVLGLVKKSGKLVSSIEDAIDYIKTIENEFS